ncbi:MAG: phospho-N-acetylmuramoyl-pentapeptide-transferase [Armatimonadota bacterium]|nr:phospho-N-acetylmuramoyl-pentapeptide-transferase [Armatimonadota bacterium]MDR5696676.1 phospho-N-acetylmuramoyl-pentapeptide-transferase [Armatimonadota bacterium]
MTIERIALAATLSAVVVLAVGPLAIPWLRAFARQPISEDAPPRHREKADVPTMGGVLMIAAVVVTLLALWIGSRTLGIVFVAFLGCGAAGLVDDLLKARRGRNLGLRAREKLAFQIPIGLAIGYYAMEFTGLGSALVLPWIGEVRLGWLYLPFAVLFMVGFTNGVNLTDGLDGLGAGTVAIAAVAYTGVALHVGRADVAAFAAALAGACLGFLWYNAHPAQVIMGDVGSQALGGALAAMAIVTKTELTLLVIGIVFVLEAASVVLQVAYFRATGGRRIFRSSPLHHHFELAGWAETQIVTRFWLVGSLGALAGLTVVL